MKITISRSFTPNRWKTVKKQEIQDAKFSRGSANAFDHFQNKGLGHVFRSFCEDLSAKKMNLWSKSDHGISKSCTSTHKILQKSTIFEDLEQNDLPWSLTELTARIIQFSWTPVHLLTSRAVWCKDHTPDRVIWWEKSPLAPFKRRFLARGGSRSTDRLRSQSPIVRAKVMHAERAEFYTILGFYVHLAVKVESRAVVTPWGPVVNGSNRDKRRI